MSRTPNKSSFGHQIITKENPFDLDYYGINFQRTFQNDEQGYQNQREYLMLKRSIDKKCLYLTLKEDFQENELAKKFEIPKYLNVDDEASGRSETRLRTKGNVVNVIRTDKKQRNAEIAGLELLRRKAEINNLFVNSLTAAPQVKKSSDLDLKTRRNIEGMIAKEDFENYVSLKSMQNNHVNNPKDVLKSHYLIKERNQFPQTLEEFNTKLKAMEKEKCVVREKGLIRKDFYKESGINRNVQNCNLGSDTSSVDSNEQDSDNAEKTKINVGYEGDPNKILLHKIESLEESNNTTIHTCQTRREWLNTLCNGNENRQPKGANIKKQQPKLKNFESRMVVKRSLNEFITNSNSTSSPQVKRIEGQTIPIKNYAKKNSLSKYFLNSESLENVISIKSGNSWRLLSNACFPRSNQTMFPNFKKQVPLPKFIKPTFNRKPAIKNYYQNRSKFKLQNEIKRPVPLLRQPENDVILSPNVNIIPKTDANKVFKVRHHHHHCDPTRSNKILVQYEPIIPQEPINIASSCNVRTLDFRVDIEHTNSCYSSNMSSLCSSKSNINSLYRSKSFDSNGTGTDENMLRENTPCSSNEDPKCCVDKNQVLDDLKAEVQSIKTCESSLSSSMCTNFTYDSGSLLLLGGEAIPLNYIRKSSVPFENIDRCRVETDLLQAYEKKQAPYYKVPFSGQLQEMRDLVNPPDTFHTTRTRIKSDLRTRIGLDDLKKKVEEIMSNCNQTQNDEFKRTNYKSFKLKTFRLEYQKYIRQKHTKKLQINSVDAIKNIEQCNHLSISFSFRLTEKAYQNYIEKLKKLADCLENTMILKNEKLEAIKVQYSRIKDKILITEKLFVENIICQKLHYLMKEDKWREINDWLHRKEDNTLESVQEAIDSRYKKFVRVKTANDNSASDIKSFYKRRYFGAPHRSAPIFVFEDKREFLNAIKNLAQTVWDSELISKLKEKSKKRKIEKSQGVI